VKTVAERVLPVPPERIWRTIDDPGSMRRWWPYVTRVEGADAAGFTLVFRTRRGNVVRGDYELTERRVEEELRWRQLTEGTPFERVLKHAETSLLLAPAEGDPGSTLVRLVAERRMRGLARLGGWLARRGTREQLDQALDGLEALVVH
jgi:uncharacterized protein YndB with AHSA1/START domain